MSVIDRFFLFLINVFLTISTLMNDSFSRIEKPDGVLPHHLQIKVFRVDGALPCSWCLWLLGCQSTCLEKMFVSKPGNEINLAHA